MSDHGFSKACPSGSVGQTLYPKAPEPFCAGCCNTGRKWVSREKIYDFVSYEIETNGKSCRWGIEVFKAWLEDHCVDCNDCG